MRFFILSILLLFVCPHSSLGFTNDAFYIETITADSVIFLDTFNFDAFAGIYTQNFTFAAPSIGLPPARGPQQLTDAAYKLLPRGSVVLQNAITTFRISFVGPTDKDYTFTQAKTIIYLSTSFFGTGNLTGQSVTIYSRLDDTLIKTSLPVYGGWRITSRSLAAFVSFFPCF